MRLIKAWATARRIRPDKTKTVDRFNGYSRSVAYPFLKGDSVKYDSGDDDGKGMPYRHQEYIFVSYEKYNQCIIRSLYQNHYRVSVDSLIKY